MKRNSRIIALLIFLSILFTGCSSQQIKTIVIEDEKDIKGVAINDTTKKEEEKSTAPRKTELDLQLSIVNNIYEVFSFNKDSQFSKQPVGWFDNEHVINMVAVPLEKEVRGIYEGLF